MNMCDGMHTYKKGNRIMLHFVVFENETQLLFLAHPKITQSN